MNKHLSIIALLLVFFFTGCSIEAVEPPAGKDKELTKEIYALDNVSPGNSLMMIYKAASSNDICYAQFIPNDEKCITLDKRLKHNTNIPQASESPSQAYYNGKIYIVHKDGATNNIYFSYLEDGEWTGDMQITVNGTNIQTSKAPAAVVHNNKLYIVYKGGSSNSVYYAYYDGSTWQGNTRIDVNSNNIETNQSPAAVVFNNKLHVFYKAYNSSLVYSSYLDGTWKGNTKISVGGNDLGTTHGPAAAVFNNKIYLFYKAGNSNFVYSSNWNGVSWSGNAKINVGGTDISTSNAPSATILNGRLYIAYRAGSSPDIYYSSFDGLVWRGDNRVYGIGTSSFANIIANPFEIKPFVNKLLSISPTAKKIYFNSDDYYPYNLPLVTDDDSHVQGIQLTDDNRFIISSSNFGLNYKKGLIVPVKNWLFEKEVQTDNIRIIEGFGHAGGIQYHAGTLAVACATTNNPTSGSYKFVRFYMDDINLPSGNLFIEQDIAFTSSNAAAVGFVDMNETQRLVVVNTNNDLDMMYKILTKVNNGWPDNTTTWKPKSHPDSPEEVQNINLFKEGDLYYLVGLRNADIITEQKRDALDVYTFTMDDTEMSPLTLLGSLYVNGDDHQRMRNGGGINMLSNGNIIISSYGREITPGQMVIWTYTK